MLNIGERITQLRKQFNLSQDELAKKINVSRTIIGNYERNTNTPSIEVLIKIAKTFNVTVDYLIGEGELSSYDKEVMKRIEDIDKLDKNTKEHLYFLVDNVIQNFKTKQAFSV
ncbi:Probable transcriptional regulator, XRE family [Flavobacterium indicum GPTSA100-9 = DSM 17447]|uniref:Probable transcriptional regulator, XRE family n=1 Tax=Flavobacterium indicum (strain DSM 17447 / CIP 109464 / GPTSA100-9) TaxID=1094466 RepID=H8XST7_FLAIG|nr:helix-turn-helix transcriptional regulator [Flavobacterium indicum]CCG53479.1 Probable transcriptional regulator, XRE family [Flavobacterium indicum GPTSA100-9 = DSM 17447]